MPQKAIHFTVSMSTALTVTDEAFEDHILAQLRRWLQDDVLFVSAESPVEKCAHACRILREEHKPETPFSVIGHLLRIPKGSVYRYWKEYKSQRDEVAHVGRPSILTTDQMNAVVHFLASCFEQREPATIFDACRFLENQFGISMIPNSLRHALAREGRIKPICAVPMEDTRMAVTIEQIQDYFTRLDELITGSPAHFIFNMDEMGHQDWADAHEKVCYVPATVQPARIGYPVSRKGKRITLIACIAADGSFVRPALVISRKTFEDELRLLGYTSDKIEIYDQPKAYIDRDIFTDWFKDTFLPDLEAKRMKFNYEGPAFLIADNCTAHAGPIFEELCALHNVIPIFLPPHASNQLQMLDLCIFGLTKRHIAKVNKLEKANVQTSHIHQILQGFYSTATPANIVASFRNGGVSLAMEGATGAILCKVTPETARCLLYPMTALEHQRGTSEEVAEEENERDPNLDEYVERIAESVSRAE